MPVELNARAWCEAADCLHRIRVAVATVFAGSLLAVLPPATCIAVAADLNVVSLTQAKPGSVIATVRTADNHPPVTAFHLLFPSAAPGAQDVLAKEVTSVTDASADLATNVIICVDSSGSMKRVVPSMKTALQAAFAAPRPDLRVSVLSFGTTVSSQLLPVSNDPKELSHATSGIKAESGPDGKTLLYMAVVKAINRLRDDPTVHSGRLLVISDGKDEGSPISLDSLVKQAHERGFRIDSIGFGGLAPQWSGSLKSLSDATGGRYVLATTDVQLSDAIRDDFGTAPLPAFKVRFDYPASDVEAPPGSAMLRYAAEGASAVNVSITMPIASPLASADHATGPSAESDAAALNSSATPSQPESWFERFEKWLAGSSSIGIRVSTLTAACLALLAVIVWVALLFRKKPEIKVEPLAVPTPSDRGPVRGPTQIGTNFPPPARGHPAAVLVGRSGDWRGKRYPIEHAMTHIGSDEKCELALTGDDYVSRRHASIRYESGTLYLSDHSSTNGTFLNGTRVTGTPSMLVPGDDVRFGHTSFEVHGIGVGAAMGHRDGDRHSVP